MNEYIHPVPRYCSSRYEEVSILIVCVIQESSNARMKDVSQIQKDGGKCFVQTYCGGCLVSTGKGV